MKLWQPKRTAEAAAEAVAIDTFFQKYFAV
jgi:hypothetical protein